MPGLDPQARAVIDAVNSMGLPPFDALSVEQVREVMRGFGQFMVPSEKVGTVVDHVLPNSDHGVPVRFYYPEGTGPWPAAVYFHGGGFCTGDIDLVDPVCRALTNRVGCAIVSVGYRLGPEYPYPAATEDAYAAVCWVASHATELGIESDRLAVLGDSAGATLATVACLMIRDRGGPAIKGQVLVYPVTDAAMETQSFVDNGEGYLVTAEMLAWFWRHYLAGGEARRSEPYCSPLRASDLSRLPRTVIVTAEYDPLRDEGEAYGALLDKSGVSVETRRYCGMIHGFFWLGAMIDRGQTLLDDIAEDLRSCLCATDG